ncbi:helix-turn-helix transcriptional regulator [Krasilnikovia sp. MM14-A1004]|uniref:helix-turn-helix transcriptional regulator n=1 Tax=Krasilnikovia sp. MM14-A1004 TaxID=3373541 RepID=UPI00399D0210
MTATRVTREPPRYRVEFDTTDPDRAREYLSAAYDTPIAFSGDRATYRFRHVRLGPGPFHLDSVDYQSTAEYRANAPFTMAMVARVHRGVRTDCATGERLGPGDLALHVPPEKPQHVRQEYVLWSVATIPPEAIAEVARNHPDDPPRPVRFTARRPAHPGDTRRWLHVVDYVTESLTNAADLIAHPLMVGPMTRLLAATLLTTFPNSCAPEPCYQDRTDATPAALSRAVGFIDANADLDISLVDVARAARVTVRAVRHAFRLHLDTTPTEYLRRVRLDRAHQELTDLVPGDGTAIADVAARWGYTNSSRFRSDYHRLYGRSPGRRPGH